MIPRTIFSVELQKIIKLHGMWLRNEEGGVRANLSESNLSGCNLSESNLSESNLSGCDLSGCDLSGCNLSGCNLRDADLSGCTGLVDPSDWMAEHLETTAEGYIAYKAFGEYFAAPSHWEIHPGAVLTEVVNPLPTLDCACGINVATRAWPQLPKSGVWRVLIRWAWLPSVVVPYTTTGKFRCGRCELIEEVTARNPRGRKEDI